MIVRMSAYVIVGVGLAFSAGSSFGESHPSPETLKLFDSDALGYPGLADQGVQQAVNILAANPSATATSDFPPLVPATVQVKLEYWKQYVEQGKQELQDAQARGVSETILDNYRQDIAVGEQQIALLETALAAEGAEHMPPPENPAPTTGDLFSTPEARAKIKAAQDAAKEALDKASHGQSADVKPIMALLLNVLSASRQLSLAGIEDTAKELEMKAMDTLKVFSASFADHCKDQSFDPLFALGLIRQNQMLGNHDLILEPCTYRVLATVSGANGWRHCGTGIGDWSFRDKFPDDRSNASGTGEIAAAEDGANKFSFRATGPQANFELKGRLEFQRKEFRAPGGRIFGVVLRLVEHRESASGHFGAPSAPEVTVDTFGREREWDVTTLNDNKPCDPSQDVWGY